MAKFCRHFSAHKHRVNYLGNLNPKYSNCHRDAFYNHLGPTTFSSGSIHPSNVCWVPYHFTPTQFLMIPAFCKWTDDTVEILARYTNGLIWNPTFTIVQPDPLILRAPDGTEPMHPSSMNGHYAGTFQSKTLNLYNWQFYPDANRYTNAKNNTYVTDFHYLATRPPQAAVQLFAWIIFLPYGNFKLQEHKITTLGSFVSSHEYSGNQANAWNNYGKSNLPCSGNFLKDLPPLP